MRSITKFSRGFGKCSVEKVVHFGTSIQEKSISLWIADASEKGKTLRERKCPLFRGFTVCVRIVYGPTMDVYHYHVPFLRSRHGEHGWHVGMTGWIVRTWNFRAHRPQPVRVWDGGLGVGAVWSLLSRPLLRRSTHTMWCVVLYRRFTTVPYTAEEVKSIATHFYFWNFFLEKQINLII